MELFDEHWKRLEKTGHCDGHGGAEYRRVRSEWYAAGQPTNIAAFIIERANIGPYDD